MAPSIAEVPTTEIVVPVKVNPGTTEAKPKVRRIIDEEGGKTTASVCHDIDLLFFSLRRKTLTMK